MKKASILAMAALVTALCGAQGASAPMTSTKVAGTQAGDCCSAKKATKGVAKTTKPAGRVKMAKTDKGCKPCSAKKSAKPAAKTSKKVA